MDKNTTIALIVSICISAGMVLGNVMTRAIQEDFTHIDSRKLPSMMQTCEKSLPRNVECKLVAVPNYEVKK